MHKQMLNYVLEVEPFNLVIHRHLSITVNLVANCCERTNMDRIRTYLDNFRTKSSEITNSTNHIEISKVNFCLKCQMSKKSKS